MEVSLHLKLLIPSTVQCFILSTPAFIKVIMTSQWFSQLHSAALTQLTTPYFLKFPPPLISGTLHHLVYLLLLSCVSSTLNGFSFFSHILHATISQDFSLPPSVGLPNHFNHSHQQPPLNLSGGSHQHHKFAMFEVKFFSSNSQFLTSLFLLIVSPLCSLPTLQTFWCKVLQVLKNAPAPQARCGTLPSFQKMP